MMGAMTGVVDFPVDANGMLGWDGYSNNYYSQEKAGICDYDFNVAFNIEDRIYLGVTLGLHDLNYNRFTSYTEDLNDDDGNENGGYTLDNYYTLKGTGVDLKLGAIVRPFEESPFRVGLAIHTPTWYDLTESYNAVLSSDILAYPEAYHQNLSDYLGADYLTYDYRMVTPWKFNVSMGTTFGGLVALGAEYEYSDYATSKLQDIDGYELGGQYSIEQYLKGVHTFRAGAEVRLAPQFSIRAGYNYSSALFADDAYNALASYRTNTEFNNIKDRNTFTFGLGYRGNVVYADLAYKYDMYKSDFYAFDDVELLATKVDNERHQLMFTLGAKF
jgi:long-subunit fatty acid transport protein